MRDEREKKMPFSRKSNKESLNYPNHLSDFTIGGLNMKKFIERGNCLKKVKFFKKNMNLNVHFPLNIKFSQVCFLT